MKIPVLYVVVPCYNEESVLPETNKRLRGLLTELISEGRIDANSRITLVDDGSKDGTWHVISELADQYELIEGLKLAHNAGHQNALWAGMMTVRPFADAVVTIDADLQDDVTAIRGFITAYSEGYEVVYGVRSKRDTDTHFKRGSAHGYYRLMSKLGVDMVPDHADYRLLSRRALDSLAEFGEINLFLRGMVPLLGFKSTNVYYERGERFAGESKYPLGKMLRFAVEGITSFSIRPIRWVAIIGGIFSLLGLLMAVYALISMALGHSVAGWPSMMVSIWVIGGVQLMAMALIGEYVGKIYTEVKRRPRYILEEYKK